jgi:hypothetical protein
MYHQTLHSPHAYTTNPNYITHQQQQMMEQPHQLVQQQLMQQQQEQQQCLPSTGKRQQDATHETEPETTSKCTWQTIKKKEEKQPNHRKQTSTA